MVRSEKFVSEGDKTKRGQDRSLPAGPRAEPWWGSRGEALRS